MIGEVDYLKSTNMFNYTNLDIAHGKCVINTGYKLISPEVNLVGNIIGNAALASTDIILDNMYETTPQYGFLGNVYNNVNTFVYDYVERPVYHSVSYVTKPINFLVDSVINGVEKGIIWTADLINNNTNIFNSDNKIHDRFNQYDRFSDNIDVGSNKAVVAIESEPAKPVSEKPKLNIDLDKFMSRLSKVYQFVGVCQLLKNFKDMKDISKIMEIECLLVSLKTDDKLVNGIFRFFTDAAAQGKVELENVLNLAVATAEKYLQIPLSNAYHFIDNLISGKSIKEYVMPLRDKFCTKCQFL
jgi:hypothetical protein